MCGGVVSLTCAITFLDWAMIELGSPHILSKYKFKRSIGCYTEAVSLNPRSAIIGCQVNTTHIALWEQKLASVTFLHFLPQGAFWREYRGEWPPVLPGSGTGLPCLPGRTMEGGLGGLGGGLARGGRQARGDPSAPGRCD